jgi:hypothetical protein
MGRLYRRVGDSKVTALWVRYHGSVEAGGKNWHFIPRPLGSWMQHDRSAAGENEC